jgi:AbrB family looped-hinge helix DNA binding protein
MRFTATASTKGQITIPKKIREKLHIEAGVAIDIYPAPDGFIGRVHSPSRILDFSGDLHHLDRGEPLPEIKRHAQERAATERVHDAGE